MIRSKHDNSHEFQDILDCYSDRLFKIAYLRLQNRQDAEDVVQEVFYQYYRRKAEFICEEHEKAWLIKVTLNACRKIWRSSWNKHRSSGNDNIDIDGVEQEPVLQKGSSFRNPEDRVLTAESNQALLTAVKLLPAKYRDVIHLFYYEDLSIREIGEVTGRKESTVTSQLTRGRDLLKKRLKEEYDFV